MQYIGSANAARGCFSGDMSVQLVSGRHLAISSLQPGTKIMSFNNEGFLQEDVFLSFMHVDIADSMNDTIEFVSLETESGDEVQLTTNHLLYSVDNDSYCHSISNNSTKRSIIHINNTIQHISFESARAVFAGKVKPGDLVFLSKNRTLPFSHGLNQQLLYPRRIASVRRTPSIKAAYAPLTFSGNILINGMAASCYAVIENHIVAHVVTSPERYFHYLKNAFFGNQADDLLEVRPSSHYKNSDEINVSTYLSTLHYLASKILPENIFWSAAL